MQGLWSRIARRRAGDAQRPSHCSVLDLSTEQAKALVLELQPGECAVIGAGRALLQQPALGWGGPNCDLGTLTKTCDRALRQAEDMTERYCGTQVVPDWVVVGLPNSSTTAETYAATIRRPEPETRVTDRELREAVKRVQRLALSQLSRRILPRRRVQEAGVELLEAGIAAIHIDGTRVTNPVGFRGRKLTIAICHAVASSGFLRTVEAMTEELGLDVSAISSGWQALARAITAREAICLDIGGRFTDVMLARNGKAWWTSSIPIGGRDFTQHLAESFNLPYKEAESLKLAYGQGKIDSSDEARIRVAITQPAGIWVEAIEEALGRMCGGDALPYEFVLCGGGSSLPGIAETVRSHGWMDRLDFARHPEVRLLGPGDVDGVLDLTGQLDAQQHVASMALASYAMAGTAERGYLQGLLEPVKRSAVFGREGWA